MNRLVALPLSGESFFLCRRDKKILIDGGYSSRCLINALRSVERTLKHIDIVVCTHGDKDHAAGLRDFIDVSQFTVGEFWLPGSWIDSVEELLCAPNRIANGLVTELDDLAKALSERQDESLYARIDELIFNERQPLLNTFGDGTSEVEVLISLRDKWDKVSGLDGEALRAFNLARGRVRYRSRKGKIGQAVANYWLGLIDTAESIRSIVLQAIKHNVRVRWFDFDGFIRCAQATGGELGLLEPLNAVEQARAPLSGLSYLAMLSARNQECLTFLSPATDVGLGVIFCGDSPMGIGPGYGQSFLASRPEPNWPIIATAPHHGSECNRVAYGHIAKWANVLCWVRAGGSKRHPGKYFKAIPEKQRACTHCPQKGQKPSTVEIHLEDCWLWPFIVPIRFVLPHRCDCV